MAESESDFRRRNQSRTLDGIIGVGLSTAESESDFRGWPLVEAFNEGRLKRKERKGHRIVAWNEGEITMSLHN